MRLIKCLYGVAGIDPRHKLAASLRWFERTSYSYEYLLFSFHFKNLTSAIASSSW